MLAEKKQALLALHGAVLLFALSGLFGKWLDLPATYIVFGRAFFSAIALFIFVQIYQGKSLKVTNKTLVALAVTGAILAFHWVSFFHAIQLSTVAIGLITFASFPVFVSFLEPIFFKEKFVFRALLQALLTLAGIYLILPQGAFEQNVLQGVIWGVLSALSFALLTLMNRKFVINISAKNVAFYQNGFAAICLIPLLMMNPVEVIEQQWLILILLGVVFTAFAHSLFNFSLKTISAQVASLAVSLEPIYAIVAAYLLLDESLSLIMLCGGAIVLITNIWASKNQS